MKRILITGINGLLGQQCVHEFESDYELIGLDIQPSCVFDNVDYHTVDLTKRDRIKATLIETKPDYIIHAAAFTNVDGAELQREACWKINVESVQHLAHYAEKINARMIHLSTDYVFDGKSGPYRETDIPRPVGYYGKSKLASENILIQTGIPHSIVRTMILYGAGIQVRPNFATWLITQLKSGQQVQIVDDQFGNPTIADDVSAAIRRIIEKDKWDIFHISGAELTDRYSFAIQIAREFELDSDLIVKTSTTALKQQAHRPLRSGFILDKAIHELKYQPMSIEESLKNLKKRLKKLKLL
jgi:dTDP-4-dehydrorhamnose reductase